MEQEKKTTLKKEEVEESKRMKACKHPGSRIHSLTLRLSRLLAGVHNSYLFVGCRSGAELHL